MIVDYDKGEFHPIGKDSAYRIWAYVDPVDGTIKVAGLGNDLERGVYRLGNDGGWGVGLALTEPTDKGIGDLVIKDFVHSAIVDGNPSHNPYAPDHAFTFSEDGQIRTGCHLSGDASIKPVYNSTQENLGQGVVVFDAF